MLRSGLVSITFRRLSVEQVADLAARAGVDGVEWGGDVHCPHGDLAAARAARERTEAAGLRTAAYGSYYRAGHEGEPPFVDVLASARELGAPLIRIWAGRRGSGESGDEYRRQVAEDSLRVADLAAGEGIRVAWEFHGGTLTDTNDSTRRLLAAVDHPNVGCYWQPPRGADVATCLEGLDVVGDRLAHVHAFTWATDGERLPLAEGEDRWRRYLSRTASAPGERFVCVKFVRGDDPRRFRADAAALQRWLAETA